MTERKFYVWCLGKTRGIISNGNSCPSYETLSGYFPFMPGNPQILLFVPRFEVYESEECMRGNDPEITSYLVRNGQRPLSRRAPISKIFRSF